MSELNELEQRIKEKFGEHQANLKRRNHSMAESMKRVDERFERCTTLADELVHSVLRPRMKKLAEFFPNAKVEESEQVGSHQSVCRFTHSERFPATARLEIGFGADRDNANFEIHYCLQILPIFFDFPKEDSTRIPLDQVNADKVGKWIEQKIGDFLDSYLKIETVEQYQSNNLATDPVCGMAVNRYHAPAQMDHEGMTYYFCVEDCRRKFAADPRAYLAGKK
jgi:YHS domain-containing protein